MNEILSNSESSSPEILRQISEQRRKIINNNRHGSGMGEDLPSPCGIIPDFVLRRSCEVVSSDHSQVE